MKFPPRLIEGYHAFTATRLPLERSRFQKLAETGQHPEVMVICCCDSRVSPEAIFDTHPGELFVVRNIANLVPPYSPSELRGVSAALEFAVQNLKVKYIIVMGHSHCGGVRAFVEHRDRPDPGDFIDKWMSLISPAAQSLGDAKNMGDSDYLTRLEHASIITTLGNLMSFPWVKSRVARQQLKLLGAYFDVGSGAIGSLRSGRKRIRNDNQRRRYRLGRKRGDGAPTCSAMTIIWIVRLYPYCAQSSVFFNLAPPLLPARTANEPMSAFGT